MKYFVRQWGDSFFEVTKLRGYNDSMLGYGTEICENDFHRLVLHCKPNKHPLDNTFLRLRRESGKPFKEVCRWRGDGNVNDIIPGLYPETMCNRTLEDSLDKVGIV